jgi:hypothetical protein
MNQNSSHLMLRQVYTVRLGVHLAPALDSRTHLSGERPVALSKECSEDDELESAVTGGASPGLSTECDLDTARGVNSSHTLANVSMSYVMLRSDI